MSTLVVSEIECRDWHEGDGCRYGVQWAINPHMEVGSVDFYRAAREHSVFVATLRLAGADVHADLGDRGQAGGSDLRA